MSSARASASREDYFKTGKKCQRKFFAGSEKEAGAGGAGGLTGEIFFGFTDFDWV
jgi:hypothetical protein